MRSCVFFCYFSTNVAQLLFDFIKHAVAHFSPFLAHFLWCWPFCVFKKLNLVDFFHIRKTYGEVWKRNIKILLEMFAQIKVLIMHAIDSYSAKSNYHLTIIKPRMYVCLRSH